MAQLSIREQRFVNNFVGSCDPREYGWEINLEADLASYRYPHSSAVRSAVNRLMGQKRKGTWTPLPEA